MKLYLVRHGESEGNISNIHQPENSPLSFEGMRQADRLADRFAGVRVDKIISSPLLRTQQTATAIAGTTGMEIEYDPRIQELRRPSILVGRSIHETEVIKIWEQIDSKRDDPSYHYSDEENFFDMKTRLQAFIKDVESRAEKDIILVSHGYAIRTMIGLFLFGPEFGVHQFQGMIEHMGISNTGITIADFTADMNWRITTVNDAAHLLD